MEKEEEDEEEEEVLPRVKHFLCSAEGVLFLAPRPGGVSSSYAPGCCVRVLMPFSQYRGQEVSPRPRRMNGFRLRVHISLRRSQEVSPRVKHMGVVCVG